MFRQRAQFLQSGQFGKSCQHFTSMRKLIECVPNCSEGRDQNVIRRITDAVESVDGVSLLDVDPGASTNRTVMTFIADPDAP